MSETKRHEAEVDERIAAAAQRAGRAAQVVRAYEKAAGHSPSQAIAYAARLAAAREELTAAAAASREVEREYTGWSRFFIVQGGHIHSTMSCSTCNKGNQLTTFGWLPELSGLTEAEAVAAHGAILCTVCYPTAPVEWTNKYEVEAARKAAGNCTGRRDYNAPSRTGYYTGNWATCDTCGERVTVTSTGRIRAHKTKAAS